MSCCFFVDFNNMSKFLNRILGMEVEMQNHVFAYFMSSLEAIIQQAKRDGKYDMGILGKPTSETVEEKHHWTNRGLGNRVWGVGLL